MVREGSRKGLPCVKLPLFAFRASGNHLRGMALLQGKTFNIRFE